MQKLVVLIGLALALAFTQGILASEKTAGESANISSIIETTNIVNQTNVLLIKKTVIKKVLNRYNSPLTDNVDDFLKTCGKYNLDCYLLPAIAGLESTFGKFIYPNSYNPFGWGGGYIMFANWNEGIETVGRGLRERYVNLGAQTTVEIGRIYSESPTWAIRVDILKKQFYNEEEKLQGLKPVF